MKKIWENKSSNWYFNWNLDGCPQFEPMPNNKPRGGMPPNDGRPQQVTDGNCTQPIYNKKKHPKDNKKNEKNVVNKDGENETDDDDEDTQAKTNSSLNYSESASIMIQRIMMVAIVIFMFSAIWVYMVKKSISKSQPVRPQRVYGVIRSSSSEFSF